MRQIIHIYTLAPATSPRRRPAFPAGTCFPHQPLFSEDSVAGQLLLKATIWQGNWGSHCWARNCPIRCGGRDTRFNIRTRSALASRRGLAVASALSCPGGDGTECEGWEGVLGTKPLSLEHTPRPHLEASARTISPRPGLVQGPCLISGDLGTSLVPKFISEEVFDLVSFFIIIIIFFN